MMDFKTEGEAFAFVSRNGWALELVPETLRTKPVCLVACRNYAWALKHKPEDAKTEDACIVASTLDCRVLRLPPARFKKPRACLEAAKADGFALEYIPMARRTAEVCMAAVRHPQSACAVLESVPSTMRTSELCLEVVKADGLNMFFACALCSTKNIDVFGSCKGRARWLRCDLAARLCPCGRFCLSASPPHQPGCSRRFRHARSKPVPSQAQVLRLEACIAGRSVLRCWNAQGCLIFHKAEKSGSQEDGWRSVACGRSFSRFSCCKGSLPVVCRRKSSR